MSDAIDSPSEANGIAGRQREIARWFDDTYRERGEAYLRPSAAYEVFLELLGARAGERLLDIACGPGLLLECAAARNLSVSGADISPVAIATARRRLPGAALTVASAEALPFGGQSFDCITCVGSLERFLNPDRALAEMRRLLKPEGRLLVMVRNSRTLSWLLLSALGRRNETGHQGADHLQAWEERLTKAGLNITATHPDQWPLMRGQQLRHALTGRGDFRTIRRGLLPLALANELIFVCGPS